MPKGKQNTSSRSAPGGDVRTNKDQRRRENNRLAAQQSRDRKKKEFDVLQVEAHNLNQRNLELVALVGDLETRAEVLAAQLSERDATIQRLLGVIQGFTAPQEAPAAPPAPMQTAVSADAGVTRSWESFQQERLNQASPVAQQQMPPQDNAVHGLDNGQPVIDLGEMFQPGEGDDFLVFDDVNNGYEFDLNRPKF